MLDGREREREWIITVKAPIRSTQLPEKQTDSLSSIRRQNPSRCMPVSLLPSDCAMAISEGKMNV